jgi:hypothetical protein
MSSHAFGAYSRGPDLRELNLQLEPCHPKPSKEPRNGAWIPVARQALTGHPSIWVHHSFRREVQTQVEMTTFRCETRYLTNWARLELESEQSGISSDAGRDGRVGP